MNKAINIDTGAEYLFNNATDLQLAVQADLGRPVDRIQTGIENLNPVYIYIDPYAADVHSLTVICGSSTYAGAREDAYQKARDI